MKKCNRRGRIFTVVLLAMVLSLTGVAIPKQGGTMTTAIAQAASFGQRNALAKAKSYLNVSAFSKKGLVEQLKFEGFTTKQANYGVKYCKANWKKQAVKKAKSYLRVSSFSKQGLLEQLLFEGFTNAQASYGVKKAYK